MAMIRFDEAHKMQVEESVDEVRQKIISAGAAYTPLIQVSMAGYEGFVVINAHQIRAVTPN